jgi:hypothetical protein
MVPAVASAKVGHCERSVAIYIFSCFGFCPRDNKLNLVVFAFKYGDGGFVKYKKCCTQL